MSVYMKNYLSKPAPELANPKRIIIACDGTWQSSIELDATKGVPSNITRLCRVLAKNGTAYDPITQKESVWQQTVYYDAGVGTADHSWFNIQSKKQGRRGDLIMRTHNSNVQG